MSASLITYYIVENLYERQSVKPWPIKWQHAPHEE